MSTTTASKDYGLENQRTVKYKPGKMSFKEYDKKMLNFRPGLKYWKTVLENYKEWEKKKPGTDSKGNTIQLDVYMKDEIEEMKLTNRIAVSTYVQGNGPETDVYTDKETANEIRVALRERFENINTMGLTKLTLRFYNVVKVKGYECPDEWFSEMLYLNDLIVKAKGTKRTDAEIIAHIINAAPREYNIPLSIISQKDINASDALSQAQTELRNYWKRNLQDRFIKSRNERNKQRHRNEGAYTMNGNKPNFDRNNNNKSFRGGKKKFWKKFKGNCKYCGKQGHKANECNFKKQKQAALANGIGSGNTTSGRKCFICGKVGHFANK